MTMLVTDPAQGIIDLYCKELKLPGLRRAYPALAREASKAGHSYSAFLSACLSQEIASRRGHALPILVSLGCVVVPCRSPTSGTPAGPASEPSGCSTLWIPSDR